MASLTAHSFSAPHPGPHLLITGGVHGDEFEPIAAILRIVELIKHNDKTFADWRGRLTLIPVVNKNAFLRGHRCADDGLDLARACPGRADGSITEQIAAALTRHIESADFYIDLHTGGTELSVYPLAGYMLHSNAEILATQRRMARAFNLPVIWGTSAELEGRSMSIARDARVPAIYCEYLGSATCNSNGVDAYVDGCLNVMAELRLIDRPKPDSRVHYVVEDWSPRSGHMQVCNPAPLSGYFDAKVKLGDIVRRGDPLGIVHSLDGRTSQVVISGQNGMVLVLRTFPRVQAGDSIGVILDLER